MANEDQQQQVPEQTPPPQDATQDAAPQEQAAPIKLDMSKSVPIAEQDQSQQPKIKLDMSKSIPIAEEKPGYVSRTLEGFGLPKTKEELYAAAEASKLKPENVPGLILGPAVDAAEGLWGYAKRVAGNVYNDAHDEYEAGRDIVEGGPVGANLGKAAYAIAHGAVANLPFIGESAENLGVDIGNENYGAAAGDVTSIVGQTLVPEYIHDYIQAHPSAAKTRLNVLKNAVNEHITTDTAHQVRVGEHQTALNQVVDAQRVVDTAAQNEAAGTGTRDQTVAAKNTLSEATANLEHTGEAVKVASERKAQAAAKAEMAQRDLDDAAKPKSKRKIGTPEEIEKSKEDFTKAIPSGTGKSAYTPEDAEKVRPLLENTHATKGTSVDSPQAVHDSMQSHQDRMEAELEPWLEKYGDEHPSLGTRDDGTPTSIKQRMVEALADDEKARPGFTEKALGVLENYENTTDPTISEAERLRKSLNDDNRGMLQKNRMDIATARATDPEFAGRYELAKIIREGTYGLLEDKGVLNAAKLRNLEASVIRVKEAAGRVISKSDTKMRGSSTAGPIRKGAAYLAKKAGIGIGAAAGVATEIPGAAEVGAMAGGAVGDTAAGILAPGDLTRSQGVARSMKVNHTSGEVPHLETTGAQPSNPPAFELPPEVEVPTKPAHPNDMTDLHADIAAYSGELPTPGSYETQEAKFLSDYAIKRKYGILEPTDKKLFGQIGKAKIENSKVSQVALKEQADEEQKATEKANADKKTEQQELIADEKIAHGAVMKATEPAAEINSIEGRTSDQNHEHEHGHIMANVAEGLEPFKFISESHPDAQAAGAAAAVQTDVSGAKAGMEGLEQRVVGVLGGPAFDEIHNEIPINRNTGARSDIARAREILRNEGGLSGDDLNKVFDELYERAKGHVSNPDALALVQANAPLREKMLHKDYHISPSRMKEYVKKLKGAYNGETPTTAGVHEGGSDGGVPEREQAGAGGDGKDENGLPAKVPAEETRKADGESKEPAGKGTETSELKKTPEPQHRQKFQVKVTEDGDTGVEPVEAFSSKEALKIAQAKYPNASEWELAKTEGEEIPRQRGYNVPTEKHLNTPDSRAGTQSVEKTMAHELGHYMIGHNEGLSAVGIMRHTHPFMDKNANAGVHWDTKGLADSTGLKFKAEKIPGMMRMAMGGIAQDEIGGLPRGENNNFSPNIKGSDANLAHRVLRTAGFTDPDTITAMLHEAVDQNKGHLTNPHVSDIIKENVGVREPGLSKQYHYSGDRLRAMGDEAAKRIKNGINDNGTNDGKAGAASGANVAGREGEAAGATGAGVRAAPKVEQSNIDHDEVLANIKRAYGVHDDPKLERAGGFITPEGRFIDLPYDHTQVIAENGGHPAFSTGDNRVGFINDTGAIRVHSTRERGGNMLAFSVPKDGVSAAAADAMQRSFGANGDRNGLLRMERADISPETRNTLSTEKEFPSASDVKPMLQKIQALEQSNINHDIPGELAKTRDESRADRHAEMLHNTADEAQKAFEAPRGQLAAHEANGGSTSTPQGENLAGKDLYSVGAHPDRTLSVDKLTPEILEKFKADNADLLSKGDRAVGTWKDPDTGKSVLDITKLHTDRDAAVKAGQDANQKAIYHLGGEGEIPTGGTGEGVEQSNVSKTPKGSSVPLMKNPLEVEGTGENNKVNTFDVAAALNEFSQKKNPALAPGSDPSKMTARAKSIMEDEAKYQLASGRTGKEWYTTEMKDHDNIVQQMRPELTQGPSIDSVPGHTAKLTLFKAAEAVLSAGQNPYNNLGATMRAWDAYHETGEFPPTNPTTGKSWGPRSAEAYGNAMDSINRLISEKGEKGAADWLLADHTVKELRDYNKNVPGVMSTSAPGAMILGEKRGPFMQNLHGQEAAFTADMWVSRSWNRWMGTLEEPTTDKGGKEAMKSDAPRNGAERGLMKESFQHVADKLKLTTSSLQAVLWYYEQGLYSAHGVAKKSLSFSDAARRIQTEEGARPEPEQTGFNYGDNTSKAGIANLGDFPVLPSKFANIHGKK